MNNLNNMRTYLVGAMDRVKDGGVEWRELITPWLEGMGIIVLNPCDKPIDVGVEDENTRADIEYLKSTGQFNKVKEKYSVIRTLDLRCVDISDFIIASIDTDVHACGTYEEITTANRQKKPILVWCKQGKKKRKRDGAEARARRGARDKLRRTRRSRRAARPWLSP